MDKFTRENARVISNGEHLFFFDKGESSEDILRQTIADEAFIKALCGYRWYPPMSKFHVGALCPGCVSVRDAPDFPIHIHN